MSFERFQEAADFLRPGRLGKDEPPKLALRARLLKFEPGTSAYGTPRLDVRFGRVRPGVP